MSGCEDKDSPTKQSPPKKMLKVDKVVNRVMADLVNINELTIDKELVPLKQKITDLSDDQVKDLKEFLLKKFVPAQHVEKVLRRKEEDYEERYEELGDAKEELIRKHEDAKEELIRKHEDALKDKEALLREQTPLRCVMIFRKKIEKLETVFALTCDLPVHDMQKAIFTYVKDKKEAAMTEIYEKLEKLKEEQRVEVMDFFNQASTKQLAEYMFSYWRQSVKEKLNSCSILNDEDKEVVADLVLNTEKQLQDININAQYPVQFNHRFIKWMYYLIFSNDRRAKAIRKSVDDSPELDLFSFCSSIAELYATSSKVYHPGSSIIFKNTVTFDDIMSTLKLDLEVDDVITLKSVEILLKAGTTYTTK